MSSAPWTALVTGAATALVAQPLWASPTVSGTAKPSTTSAQSIALDYSAPPTCPSALAFRASVEELTRSVRWDDASARRFVVNIEERPSAKAHGRFSGSVREGRSESAPSVAAGDCRDVASALALTVALAIDPEALSTPAPDATAETPVAPSTPREAPPGTAAPPSGEQPAQAPSGETQAADERPHGLELGLQGSLHFGRGPGDVTPLVGLSVEALRRVPFRLSASLEVGWGRSANSELELRWEPSGRLALCPLWLEPARRLALVACVGSEVARLVSEGGDAFEASPPSAVRTFWSVDARARVRIRFAPVMVEVFGGAELPLTHIEYRKVAQDGSEPVIFSVDRRVGAVAGVGVSGAIF